MVNMKAKYRCSCGNEVTMEYDIHGTPQSFAKKIPCARCHQTGKFYFLTYVKSS